MPDDLVVANQYGSDMDAELGRQLLESEGVNAIIMKDDAGGMMPQFQMVEGVRLMVRSEDLERALEILEQADVDDEPE